jgi:hypothetical protein
MRRRPGFTIAETVAAATVLIAAIGLTAQLVAAEAASRRGQALRMIAVQEADAALERIAARPFAEITEESAREIVLSESARRQLPGGEIAIRVAAEGAEAKRIAAGVSWRGPSGGRAVRLVTWAYRDAREGAR